MDKLVLRSFQSPGDVVMMTAAVRDLHAAYPNRFQTDVRTSADAVWENNPHLTRLSEGDHDVHTIDMHYPLIHQSNQRPYHFLHAYVQYLEQHLDLRIPVTRFAGDIHLSDAEKAAGPPGTDFGVPNRYWILIAGGKYDFTAKWWNPQCYQAVVDHFRDRATFVQCGEAGHWHPRLDGVVDLVGKTTLREFIRLIHYADGVLCPVTLAMHLAAAVEFRPGRPRIRPCVVVAGGREPAHWEAYPNHQFISTNGALPCCAQGGCWKSRCQLVGDGDTKDKHDVCEVPVQVADNLRIPMCLTMITPEDVIRRMQLYYDGGILSLNGNGRATGTIVESATSVDPRLPDNGKQGTDDSMLIRFRHGLGDAVQLTTVLKHLARYRPSCQVDVAALVGKHTASMGLCNRTLILDRDQVDEARYTAVYDLSWDECSAEYADCPSTKASYCLRHVFGIQPVAELCHYQIERSAEARAAAAGYLDDICGEGPRNGRFRTVFIHYEGNTSAERKNLTHAVIADVCRCVRESGFVPVMLDWDNRSPLPDGRTIFNPGANHPLWRSTGTGCAEMLAALIEASTLMVGIDSGPLHVSGATSTPTLGVWTEHHPVRYFDHAANVEHLVPGDHARMLGAAALSYFQAHYRHRTYKQLDVDLPALVESMLTGEAFEELANKRFLGCLRSASYDKRYYLEHQAAGLDYLGFGEWQQAYGRWLGDALDWRGRRVLDVGCACGSILRGLGQAGVVVQGVDLCEYMIQRGREAWPDMAPLLHVCDAVNLHLFADETWDGIHTAQVAEHWKPELVPFILRELARVTRPGGLLFCSLDTEELCRRQTRVMEQEDPTHICIRPLAWWHEHLDKGGWELCSDELAVSLRDHSESFFSRYDWDWFAARKRDS